MTTPEVPAAPEPAERGLARTDEEQLADLGYKQELTRAWSGFTNFAISFTIISVLAGTFTTFSFAWQNGGPIAASIDRLVQHRRPRRDRGLGGVRRCDLPQRVVGPLRAEHLRRRLRRQRARAVGD